MFKNRKAVSKLLAAVMAIGMLPAFSIAANAEETEITWAEPHFEETFSDSTLNTAKEGIKYSEYAGAVELQSGGYVKLTPANVTNNQSDATGAASSKWCIFLNAFEGASDAEAIKLEYKMKFSTVDKLGTGTTNWGEHEGLHTKVYTNSKTRNWSVRITPQKWQLQNNGAAASYTGADSESWYTVTHVYTKSDNKLVSTVSVNDNITKTRTTDGPIVGYLFGCDAAGKGICIDDITVSYAATEVPTETPTVEPTEAPTEAPTPTPAPVAEDFTLTFDGASAVPADTAVVTYNENISAVENDALKITGNNGDGAVIINIIESDAKAVAVEFDAKLTTLDAYTNEVPWKGYDGIHTKLKPTSGNRFYAVRLSPALVQLYGTTQQEHPCVADWYHIKHVWDKATNTLYTTVSADGTVIMSDIKTKVTGIAQYNLGTDTTHNCLYDNIKVSYLDEPAEYATFAREVQFDPSDAEGKGTLRFKAGVTDAVANGAGAGFAFVNFAANNGSVVSLDKTVTNEAVAEGDVFYYDITGLETATVTGEAEVIYTAGFYAVPYLSDGANKYYGMPFTFTGSIVSEDGSVVTQTK